MREPAAIAFIEPSGVCGSFGDDHTTPTSRESRRGEPGAMTDFESTSTGSCGIVLPYSRLNVRAISAAAWPRVTAASGQ